MTRLTKTFTASENWTIPSNAINIQYIIRGGRGGNCNDAGDWNGNWSDLCYGKGGQFGAQGQYLSGSLADSYAGQNINFTQGLQGVDNNGSVGSAADSGSLGGAGVNNGGPGGLKPTNTSGALTCSAGGGAGGGGSSAFKTENGTIMVEAGGGGGAGGDGRDFNSSGVGVYNSPGVVSHYQGMGTAPASVNQNPRCDSNIQNGWFTRTGSGDSDPLQGIRTLVVKWQGTTLYEGPAPSYLSTYGEIYVENNGKGYRCTPSTYRGSVYGWCGTDACGTCSPPFGDECNSFDVAVYRIPVIRYSTNFVDPGDANYVSDIWTTYNHGNGQLGGQGSSSGNAGSGGGGGGFNGNGGTNNIAGNQMPGFPGYGGGGYHDTSLVVSCTSTTIGYENWATQTFVDDGWAEISWEESPVPIVNLVSNDADNTINRGESITLTWSSSGGTSYTMTGVANPGASGSTTITPPSGTNVYTFTATNSSGTSSTSITITVNLQAPTASLTSDDSDNIIISGDSQTGDPVTLTWSGTGFDITNYTMTGVANPGASGAITVSPNTTTTYTYALQNATGSASASQTIVVYDRPVVTLTANASTIARGANVRLTWNTTGDGTSVVWASGNPVPSSTAANGTQLVAPQESTQYCVYATGPGGISDTQCVPINVLVPDTNVADNDTTYTSSTTVNIPPWAINTTVELAGSSGGGGGTDAGGSGGGGGAGRKGILSLPDYTARTLTLTISRPGVAGFGCVANSGVGGGGSGIVSGGSGGRSGPSGCSGGGGGGGGATGVFDSIKNGYIAVAGGGGGGGGASWNRSATGGGNAGAFSTGTISLSNGSTGASCPTDGGGGGGGGGGASGGGAGGFGLDNNYGGSGGGGGGSKYDNSYASLTTSTGSFNYGNGFVRVRYDVGAPEITSFTASPSPIIAGDPVTLTWTSTNSVTGTISPTIGSVNVPDDTIIDYPSDDITYTLEVVGPGGAQTDTAIASVIVYIPPVVTLSLSSSTIIIGASTTLSWPYSGDADTITWTRPAGNLPSNTNLTGTESVSPSQTTTYGAVVSGLGGVSPESTITLTVYYPPTLTVDYPAQIDYGQQATIDYEGDYANTSVTLTATYNYDYVGSTSDATVNLNAASSAEFGSQSSYSGTYNTVIPYNDRGPLSVSYVIVATGSGGSVTESFTVPINVDRTPDNINIEENDGLFKDQQPIFTPETEILSEMYLIDDIDIQTEIKADFPINVDVNANQQWESVRQIGTPPPVQGNSVGGNSFPTEPGVYRIKPSSVVEEDHYIAKVQNLTAEEYAALVTCVSVIDETNNSAYNNQGYLNNVWQQSPAVIGAGTVNNRRGFRTAFPYRTFYILDPQGSGQSGINVPTNYPSDPNAFGPIRVNRDNGNAGSRSDWFSICNFGNLPYGTIVSIWIDISGSMTLDTVQASYDYFLTRCANAGIEIVLSLSASGEQYIQGHIQYLPPSANFNATYVDGAGNTFIDGSDGNDNIQIIAGESITLSWIVFGDVNNMSVNPGVQNQTSNFANYVKTVTVNPTEPTRYDLVVNGPAGNTTRSIDIDVLIPPTITLTASSTVINAGGCTTISWQVFGDGNAVSWTQGAIANTNANSSETVCPDDTQIYCAVASGPGGVSPETCIEITVNQAPTASLTAPAANPYNVDFSIDYETQYANTSITIIPTFFYLNGTTVTGTSINPTPATSAELGSPDSDTVRSGTVPITVPWNNFGPSSVAFTLTAQGSGGSATANPVTTIIDIDQQPDNFIIDETEDVIKNQDPVYTPETEILSEMYLINDIDIPVEIKADYPIKVDINKNDDWEDVRQI